MNRRRTSDNRRDQRVVTYISRQTRQRLEKQRNRSGGDDRLSLSATAADVLDKALGAS